MGTYSQSYNTVATSSTDYNVPHLEIQKYYACTLLDKSYHILYSKSFETLNFESMTINIEMNPTLNIWYSRNECFKNMHCYKVYMLTFMVHKQDLQPGSHLKFILQGNLWSKQKIGEKSKSCHHKCILIQSTL